MIMVIYHARQAETAPHFCPASLPSPFGGLGLLRNPEWHWGVILSQLSRANEIESSEPLRERGYPDSGPTIVLIISMEQNNHGPQFPRFLQDDQARLQGLKATSLSLIFHPCQEPTGLFSSTPLHLPSGPLPVPSPTQPKGTIKISEATVWVQFPSA